MKEQHNMIAGQDFRVLKNNVVFIEKSAEPAEARPVTQPEAPAPTSSSAITLPPPPPLIPLLLLPLPPPFITFISLPAPPAP